MALQQTLAHAGSLVGLATKPATLLVLVVMGLRLPHLPTVKARGERGVNVRKPVGVELRLARGLRFSNQVTVVPPVPTRPLRPKRATLSYVVEAQPRAAVFV